MNKKVIIISSSVVVVGAIVYLVINGARKKKEIAAINHILDNAINESGTTIPSVKEAFTPSYWQDLNKAGKTSVTKADADYVKAQAQIVYDSIHFFGNDKAAVIGVFTSIPSRAKVSMLNDAFITAYKKDIRQFLEDNYSLEFNKQLVSLVQGKKDF